MKFQVSTLVVGTSALLVAVFASACAVDATQDGSNSGSEGDTERQLSDLTAVDDFRIGIQLANNCTSIPGDEQTTATYENGTTTSDWACDGKGSCFDPDAARLELIATTQDNVKQKDFRICMQAADGQFNHTPAGATRCTPWASQGGGATGMVTDTNSFDPDSYRVSIETRTWPTNAVDQQVKFRLRIRAWDNGKAFTYSSYSGWSNQGGGFTGWAVDGQCFDVDGFEIDMDIEETVVTGAVYCNSTDKCQHGFGDCNTNADCVTGTQCVQNVGNQYGYVDNAIDVCVDIP